MEILNLLDEHFDEFRQTYPPAGLPYHDFGIQTKEITPLHPATIAWIKKHGGTVSGFSFVRIAGHTYSENGIFTIPMRVVVRYIYIFMLFGAFLKASGVGNVIISFANAIAGKTRGGPAKVAMINCITPPVALAAYAAASLAEASPIKTATTATRLGIVAYFVPVLFVYNQELLLIGNFLDILESVFFAAIGF